MLKDQVYAQVEQQTPSAEQVTVFLETDRKEICASCIELLRELPAWHSWESSYPDLNLLARRGLDAFLESLSSGNFTIFESYLANLNIVDFSMDTNVADAIDVLFLIREATMSVLRRRVPCGAVIMLEACARLDVCLRYAVNFLVRQHALATSNQLRERQERTATLLKIVEAATTTLDLDRVLQLVGSAISTVLNVPRCALGLVDEDRSRFIYQVVSLNESVDSPKLTSTMSLSHPLSEMGTLAAHILERQEPVVCVDTETDPRALGEWKHLIRSILGVPFIVKGRVVAMGFAYTFDEYRDFDQEQIDLACGIANAVALCIENAWLHQKMKEMVILEERDRLAREMHGNLAQVLGALQLKASQVAVCFDGHRVREAHDRLGELENIISAAHTDVRETIFNMRSVFSPESGFLPALQEYLTAYKTRYGLDVQLEAEDDLEPDWTGDVMLQVVRVIQEALTNVRKHARTDRAKICIRHLEDWVQISVLDRGCGFDPRQVMSQAGHHVGLQLMRERMESMGGRLEIESQFGDGTCVILSLPSSANRGNV
ncbi:ATP-binding protein [Phosphitispora sp. TUW77]|uniref:GAF domain-containing sensor histidine kinase n=1 Tax=Phosphitispora sp. TUW77 TaxID=3152361 RepID=UPI003AB46465